MLIAARGLCLGDMWECLIRVLIVQPAAVQGFGSGGCLAVTEIIYADLVPLPQRGIIQGITAV